LKKIQKTTTILLHAMQYQIATQSKANFAVQKYKTKTLQAKFEEQTWILD